MRDQDWQAKARDMLARLATMQPPNVILQQITMLGEARDLLTAALQSQQDGAQGGVAVAWAAHRYGQFGYIWHELDDVQGWVDLRNRALPADARWHGPVALYTRPAIAPQWGDDAAWSAGIVSILSGYGFSTEAASVFASAELAEYRAGECDCAELLPIDIADLLMDAGASSVEKWKRESVGRPYGYKPGRGTDAMTTDADDEVSVITAHRAMTLELLEKRNRHANQVAHAQLKRLAWLVILIVGAACGGFAVANIAQAHIGGAA